jgi:hypothetical protein
MNQHRAFTTAFLMGLAGPISLYALTQPYWPLINGMTIAQSLVLLTEASTSMVDESVHDRGR